MLLRRLVRPLRAAANAPPRYRYHTSRLCSAPPPPAASPQLDWEERLEADARQQTSSRTGAGATAGAAAAAAPKPQALAGIRVLDFSRILAGPYASMLLADLGADVIKIENPSTGGDDTRTWGPPFTPRGHQSCYFMSFNRNKRSIAVDLKSESGRRLIYDMIPKADVVLENLPPGKMDKLGLGYSTLSALNPRLVYASITGWGATGPYASRPGYDVMASAMGGLMTMTGTPSTPVKVGVAITDVCTGLYTHGAIMAALLARHHTGRGQYLDTSIYEVQVATLGNIGHNWLLASHEAKRWGTAHESIVPYQAFTTSDDKHIICGALNQPQWKRFCRDLIHKPEWESDARFHDNPSRVTHRAELIDLLTPIFRSARAAEWLTRLTAAEIPHAPIHSMEQVFADPQVIHRQMIASVSHRTAGVVKLMGPAVKYSDTPCRVERAPPLMGEHTNEILTEFGVSAQLIAQLRKEGAVQQYTDDDDSDSDSKPAAAGSTASASAKTLS